MTKLRLSPPHFVPLLLSQGDVYKRQPRNINLYIAEALVHLEHFRKNGGFRYFRLACRAFGWR